MSATPKHVRWLRAELGGWVGKGLVSSEQVEAIRRAYPEPGAGLPWGTILFSGLGAVVAGLGGILVLAYNWHALGKGTKLSVIFLALAASHGAGLWQRRRGGSRALGEAACLLGSMFFGAGIWLVAQIYHIDEHYPNGFLLWAIGVLALAWAIPSLAHACLAVVLLLIYAGTEALGFEHPVGWGPWLLLAGVGGVAWRAHSRWLLAFVLAGFTLTLLFTAIGLNAGLILRIMLFAGLALLAVGAWLGRQPEARPGTASVARRFPGSAPLFAAVGWVAFLTCLYLLTFRGLASELYGQAATWAEASWPLRFYGFILPMMTLAGWVVLALSWRRHGASGGRALPYESWLGPVAGIVLLLLPAAQTGVVEPWLPAAVFNLLFLAFTAAWMSRGCREGSLRHTVTGSLMLVLLVTARFFDLFENLAWRGGLFLATGGLLFAEGIFFRRARRHLRGNEPEAVL